MLEARSKRRRYFFGLRRLVKGGALGDGRYCCRGHPWSKKSISQGEIKNGYSVGEF
jgi:hypothetical protein